MTPQIYNFYNFSEVQSDICFKFSDILNLSLSGLCTGLPHEILNLTTDKTFPVSYNTAVTVSCFGDGKLRGDNVITCNQDTKFQFEVKPRCNELGMYRLEKSIISIVK